MYAVRNSNMCTKDCICLYVCPTGATATEDGSIDKEKCLDGCTLCVDSCPSKAIYQLPRKLGETKKADSALISDMLNITEKYGKLYFSLIENMKVEEDKNKQRLLKALAHSAKVLSQDGLRGCGYLKAEEKLINEVRDNISSDDILDKIISCID